MKKTYTLPSKEVLDQLLRYDPKTGEFFWRVRPVTMFNLEDRSALTIRHGPRKRLHSAEHACNQWNARWAGKPAMTKRHDGYQYGRIFYQGVLAHRVAWKIMTGQDPIEVDHIDGNRSNNKWTNLRNGTRSDNQRNTALRSTNKSGYHGVRFNTQLQRWTASVQLGTFDSKEEAIAARKHAEVMLGFHPNHGRATSFIGVPNGRAPSSISKSGTAGVVWDDQRECWRAYINVGKEHHYLGRFASKDEAIEARRLAEEEHFGMH